MVPWLVPAIRIEDIQLRPTGAPNVNDLHLMPGVAFLVRPDLKLVLVANVEIGRGFPQDSSGAALAWQGGSADWGSFVLAPADPTTPPSTRKSEFESIALFLAWAM